MEHDTLEDFLVDAAQRKFGEEEDEDRYEETPNRLEPVRVLERVLELLERRLKDIREADIKTLRLDVEDCIYALKPRSWRGTWSPRAQVHFALEKTPEELEDMMDLNDEIPI